MSPKHWLVLTAAAGVLAATTLPGFTPGAGAQSASDGTRTLTASQVSGLDPEGAVVTVTGSGYDIEKGIYIAFCLVPPPGAIPSPCGGGINLSGEGGASKWISSNPPANGEGLAIPYGPGGTFSETLTIGALIGPGLDCRLIACAIVTRSDHTRLTDRSQDIIIPVTFIGAATPTPPPFTATPAPGSTATATPSPTTIPTAVAPAPERTAPAATLSSDGRRATAGALQLAASAVSDLDPEGAEVVVTGDGYNEAQGVYIALCAVADGSPDPCSAGSKDAAAWVSSNPPEYGKDLAMPYEAGGAFEVRLVLKPVIDAATDCRVVECAIVSRSDDTTPGDRSQELVIPVHFSAVATTSATVTDATATPGAATTSSDGGGGSSSGWLVAAGIVLALIAGGAAGAFALLKRRGKRQIAMIALAAMVIGACSDNGGAPAPDASPSVPGREDIVILPGTPTPQLPVTISSADGREVTVTDVSRIVPLWGNLSEVVFGLGLGDNVVARDSTATFPEAADLPIVTRAHDVSAESVLSLHPTVVLASSDNSGPQAALDQIRNVGIPVIVFDDPESIEDVIPRIRAIAAALGVSPAGETLVEETRRDLEAVQAAIPQTPEAPRIAFLYMRGQAGIYLLGGPKSGADSMIRAAGGIDAGTAMGLDQPFTPITSEALVEAAPDVILMTTTGLESVGGIDGLVKIPGIAQTPAGKERRIVTVEDALLYSFGPRTPVALAKLIERLYGEPTPSSP